jgi:hypothetical protein
MPMIRLKNPLATGGLEEHDYTHAKVVEVLAWNLMGNAMTLHVLHGAYDAQAMEFVPASIHAASTVRRVVLQADDYAALVARASTAVGEPLAEGLLRSIYELLLAIPDSPYEGVVVDNLDRPYGAPQ